MDERVKHQDASLFQVEKDKQLTHTFLNRARDGLAKAQEAARELDLAHSVAVHAQKDTEAERDRLKAELNQYKAQAEGFGLLWTRLMRRPFRSTWPISKKPSTTWTF